ncbi:MAG: hypothetical protein Q7U51_15130 [Methanoregula sp.]|nr:hypothetical protein [Methanoregula sp.]
MNREEDGKCSSPPYAVLPAKGNADELPVTDTGTVFGNQLDRINPAGIVLNNTDQVFITRAITCPYFIFPLDPTSQNIFSNIYILCLPSMR